jgi:hypothetical protein
MRNGAREFSQVREDAGFRPAEAGTPYLLAHFIVLMRLNLFSFGAGSDYD